MNEIKEFDVIIIGAGPAGMTAGIYASRSGLNVGLIEAGAPGGQMVNTYEIENYTGIDKISGPELSMKMFDHAKSAGANYLYGDVSVVTQKEDKTFLIDCTSNQFSAKTVIVATGTKHRKLEIPGEAALAGRGISWCAVCDGAFYKGLEVAVIGGGNSAVEEALYLTNIVEKVYIIHRRDELRADKVIASKAFENEKVEFIFDTIPTEFVASEDGKFESIKLMNVKTKEVSDLAVAGAFIYVGNDPVTHMLDGMGVVDEFNNVIVDEFMKTSVPGLFAAGDVIRKSLRQIVTATNDGAIAAGSAHKYLEK